MMRMGPPQQGHGSRRVSGMISSGSGAVACSGRWTQSRARIFVMLALRVELARVRIHNQYITRDARAMAERNTLGHRS